MVIEREANTGHRAESQRGMLLRGVRTNRLPAPSALDAFAAPWRSQDLLLLIKAAALRIRDCTQLATPKSDAGRGQNRNHDNIMTWEKVT